MIQTRDQLTAAGHSMQSLGRLVAAGGLIRVRPGFYLDGAARHLSREERHLLMVLAASRALDEPVFSHWSAALVHGLPVWGQPLGKVAVARGAHVQRSGASRLIRFDVWPLDAHESVVVDGLRVTSPARSVVDIARTTTESAGVVVADAALHRGLVTPDQLDTALADAAGRAGIRRARATIRESDARSESVAESRSRLIFRDHDLPEPERQVDIFDPEGKFVARVDFLWREFGVIGECDGLGKYLDGADEMEVRRRLAHEKDRDAALMALGYRLLHWRWGDLDKPPLLARRVRSVLHPSAA